MKTYFKVVCLCILMGSMFTSCVHYREIGRLTMVSTRNVNPAEIEYTLLASYAGDSKKDMKKTAGDNLVDAIDNLLKRWPGGEYMTNVKFYEVRISGHKQKKYAVSGDIYGVAKKESGDFSTGEASVKRSIRGFEIGESVMWRTGSTYQTGIIKALKDDDSCLVETKDGKIVLKKYTQLSK